MIFFDFPKVYIKLGKVKKFGVNQIKNGAVGAIFPLVGLNIQKFLTKIKLFQLMYQLKQVFICPQLMSDLLINKIHIL